jgi:hypothetical protein
MKKTWIAMQFISLLVSLLTIGCGAGSGNHDPQGLKTSMFSPPSITELVPNSVPVNSVPFAITINGTNFLTDATVFWNGTPVITIFEPPTSLWLALRQQTS